MTPPRIQHIRLDWSEDDQAYIASCEHQNLIAIEPHPVSAISELLVAATGYFEDQTGLWHPIEN